MGAKILSRGGGGGGGGSLTDHQHTTTGDGGSVIRAVTVGASLEVDVGDPTTGMGGVLKLFDNTVAGRYVQLIAPSAGLTANRSVFLPNLTGTVALIGAETSPASVAGTIAAVNLPGQTANITSKILMKTCPLGFYSVWAYLVCTSGVGGAADVKLNLIYTDVSGSRTAPIATLTMTTNGVATTVSYPFYKTSTADANWTITGYTAGTFALYIRGMSTEA